MDENKGHTWYYMFENYDTGEKGMKACSKCRRPFGMRGYLPWCKGEI
jgi:hypothetical protein